MASRRDVLTGRRENESSGWKVAKVTLTDRVASDAAKVLALGIFRLRTSFSVNNDVGIIFYQHWQ